MQLNNYELDEVISLIQYEIEIMKHILKLAEDDLEISFLEKEKHKNRLHKLLDTKYKLLNMRYHNETILQ